MGLKLRPYQDDAADFLYEHDRALVLAPVGAGKTCITITALDALYESGHLTRALVLAPKRVCTDVWPQEIAKWGKCLRATVAVGTPRQRAAAFAPPAETGANVVVLNYDGIQWLADQVPVGKCLTDIGFNVVVFDELTRLKNPSGKRFKALEKLIKDVPIRWGLTGSFTSNGLEDVYGQCRIVDQALLGRAKGAFLQKYFVCVNRDFGEWQPRRGALEQVMAAIKPATFVLEPGDYADKLPPLHDVEMRCDLANPKPYNDMKRKFVLELGDTEIAAPSAAAVTMKLQQLACIAEGTPVLTERGWQPIGEITCERVWDGVEWVRHRGVIFQGIKETILCNNVRMTYDHKLLTVEGWKTAEEFNYANASRRLDRAAVRLPDGSISQWVQSVQVRSLALPLCLWQRGDARKSVSTRHNARTTKELRLSSRQRDPSNDQHPSIQNMADYAATLLQPNRKGLPSLRRAKHICLRAMARFQRVLARYAAWVRFQFDVRSYRQQRAVFAGELPVGRLDDASQQQKQQPFDRNARRAGYDFASRAHQKHAGADSFGSHRPVWLDDREGAEYARTYDILSCGPRNRFVVQGVNGELLIVHNCGFIYDSTSTAAETPGRFHVKQQAIWLSHEKFELLDDILAENQGADTLVVYNFKEELAELQRRYPHARTLDEPDAVTRWNAGKTRLLLLHPKSAGHGLNLQGNPNGNKIVFLSLPWSLELYEQTVGRLHRGGQCQDVWCYVLICNKTVDERIWQALHDKRAISDIAIEELRDV